MAASWSWRVEQLSAAALATSTAKANARSRALLVAAWLAPARVPTLRELQREAPLRADTATWGRWLATSELLSDCRPLLETGCVVMRRREWKVKVTTSGSGGATSIVALDPFATIADSLTVVQSRVPNVSGAPASRRRQDELTLANSAANHVVLVRYPATAPLAGGSRGCLRVAVVS